MLKLSGTQPRDEFRVTWRDIAGLIDKKKPGLEKSSRAPKAPCSVLF